MFGVDQCRMCGKTIVVKSPKAREEQEKAIRQPVVPEKVWRKAGFLTPPTRTQWFSNPADGCCADCGRLQMRRKHRPLLRLIILVGGAVSTIVFVGSAWRSAATVFSIFISLGSLPFAIWCLRSPAMSRACAGTRGP